VESRSPPAKGCERAERQGLGPIGPPTCEPKRARFGGREVLDVVDLPDPVPGDGEQLYEVSTAGISYADTHQAVA
jgi:hypothetical protein